MKKRNKPIKISESQRSERGNLAEELYASKYGGEKAESKVYDILFPYALAEVKTASTWHITKYKYHDGGRYSIERDEHKELKRLADAEGKLAIYIFVKIPRYDDGRSEADTSMWVESWMKWEDVDRLAKKTNRKARNVFRAEGRVRNYYRIKVSEIFGEEN